MVAGIGAMRRVVEIGVAVAAPRSPGVEIDGQGMRTGLGERVGELLVVGMQTADIGEDHDTRCPGVGAPCEVGGHRRPVTGDDGLAAARGAVTALWWRWWCCLGVEAHRRPPRSVVVAATGAVGALGGWAQTSSSTATTVFCRV